MGPVTTLSLPPAVCRSSWISCMTDKEACHNFLGTGQDTSRQSANIFSLVRRRLQC
jgi:hypothetical protein